MTAGAIVIADSWGNNGIRFVIESYVFRIPSLQRLDPHYRFTVGRTSMTPIDDASLSPSEHEDERLFDDADENTLRIMLSTDNHLGYAERDPIRGMDSFAAFEEVLYLAKEYKVRSNVQISCACESKYTHQTILHGNDIV